MKVLITGGYGFIGSFVAEKFYQEGHDIYILDDLSSGKKENVIIRHKSFITSITSGNCENIFKGHSFDIVIHLAANVDVTKSINMPTYDANTNIVGLLNMLQLSAKYNVKKFIFASSAAVYGDTTLLPIKEDDDCKPISPYGMSKSVGEYYCEMWSKHYNLETACLRFSNVYGPRQGSIGEAGVAAIFLNQIMKRKQLTVYGNGEQTRDFIFVRDVAEAIFRVVMSDCIGIYNVSSNTETHINQLLDEMESILESTGVGKLPSVNYTDKRVGDIENSKLDNCKITDDTDWAPKYSITDGMCETFHWFYQQKTKGAKEELRPEKRKKDVNIEKFIPLFENLIIFIAIVVAHFSLGKYFPNIDMKLIYVLIIALFFGKTQAVIACALVIILFSYENIIGGRDFITLFIDNQVLTRIAVYLFIGLIVGYIVDRKKVDVYDARQESQATNEKYDFLTTLYQEIRDQKEELETQIIESEDGIGKIYSMVQKLDSLEPDDIFIGAISVVEQTMKTNAVSIYLVNENRFLRLVSKSRRTDIAIPASLSVSDQSVIDEVIRSKHYFYNKNLDNMAPQMIAPIIKNDKTIALVKIHEMNFENLTLYYQNLFHVITSLISSSVIKATDYVQATHKERYVDGTNVLKYDYFMKKLSSKQNAWKQFKIPYTKLKLDVTYKIDEADQVSQYLRETDYVGVDSDGSFSILLPNTDEKTAKYVIDRLRERHIPIGRVENE